MARTPAFAPMEYSKLGLEQFTPDYVRFFRGLDEAVRDRLEPSQWQLYKGISDETIAEIYDELYQRTVGGGWPGVTHSNVGSSLRSRLSKPTRPYSLAIAPNLASRVVP